MARDQLPELWELADTLEFAVRAIRQGALHFGEVSTDDGGTARFDPLGAIEEVIFYLRELEMRSRQQG